MNAAFFNAVRGSLFGGALDNAPSSNPRRIVNGQDGTIEVPLRPAPEFVWRNGGWERGDVGSDPDPNTINLPRREFRRALLHNGMNTGAVMAIISGIEDETEREEMEIWWEDTQHFERNHPHLIAMTQAAGLTEQQADAIWSHGVDLLNGD